MSNESNHAGQIGANYPGRSADWFKRNGMNETQAAEAAAAAKRAQAGNKS